LVGLALGLALVDELLLLLLVELLLVVEWLAVVGAPLPSVRVGLADVTALLALLALAPVKLAEPEAEAEALEMLAQSLAHSEGVSPAWVSVQSRQAEERLLAAEQTQETSEAAQLVIAAIPA